jgi:uncharacterized protein (TIGR03435 family)
VIALGLVWLCLRGVAFDTALQTGHETAAHQVPVAMEARQKPDTPGQQQAPPPVRKPDLTIGPPYDIVSVKPNTSGGTSAGGLGFPPGGRFSATNVTLREMIGAVYGPEFLGAGRIVGGPDWMNTERFDVEVESKGDPAPAQRRLMVRTLLAEYFKLKLRFEEREMRVLALRRASSDGRLKPGFKESRADCPKMDVPPPPPPAGGAMPRPCGVDRQRGKLIGYGAAPSQFARILAAILSRPVVDATDLNGRFDFELQYGHILPDDVAKRSSGQLVAEGVSIFTAIQEQLGLKLSDERMPIAVLVIDNAERPKQ